jgi:hypothetical protein
MNKKKRSWDELFAEAEVEVRQWRTKHKPATWAAIENEVDTRLAAVRARMVQELALESELADIKRLERAKRPKCPLCERPLSANGQVRRQMVTDHEQVVELEPSKVYCSHCKVSFFPSG